MRTFIMAQVVGYKRGKQIEIAKDSQHKGHVRIGEYSISLSDLEEALSIHEVKIGHNR